MGAGEKSVCIFYSWMFFLLSLSLPNLCITINSITPSSPLSQGQSLVSPNQIYELGLFTLAGSGNQYLGIWYHKISPQTVVWVANREKPLATDSLGILRIGMDGNLKLMDGNKTSIWSTNVLVKMTGLIALLLDSGNFVIQDAISGQNFWESFDHPCDTFISGMKIGLNSVTGEKQYMTSWKSETDPSPGSFVLGITADTPSECFIWKGGAPYWRGGQWDKSTFIGQPTLSQSYLNGFDLQQDVQRGTAYLHVDIYNKSSLEHLVLTPTGSLRLAVLDKGKNQWTVSWANSMSKCDMYGVCGPFGICREKTSSPICKCLKGFVPKSEEEWGRGNWTRGCVRRTPLHCEESSTKKRDVFQKMTDIKLPDFSQYVPVPDEQACQSSCLQNCSCRAYTYVTAIGCMLWTRDLIDVQQFSFPGKDLFLRLSHSEIDEEKQHKALSISLTTIAALVLILATLACGLRGLRFMNQRGNMTGARRHSFFSGKIFSSRDSRQEDWRSHFSQQDQSELPMFDFCSILLATNEFNVGNKLGQGGFGPVYKGELKDGTHIAVKRLSSSSGQGIEEFKNEIILISKLQHRNLVRLLGCCIEGEEKLLIYEYMPNKSLDMFLFDPSKRHQLDWGRRFDIVEGVARGLLYLHRDSCLKVIHRDLKVSNILLDEKMNPKISDFGLARIFEGTQDLANTHRVVGTLGYMSPEYAIGGIFSHKSDVFSFGVLLLEIVSGKKNTGFLHHGQQINLIAYAWELWTEKRELDLVDESLSKSFCPSQVTRCIRVGLLCVQDQPADRPSMSAVLPMLCCEIECPKPKEPTLTFKKSSTSWDYYDHLLETSNLQTINQVTVTMVQGR